LVTVLVHVGYEALAWKAFALLVLSAWTVHVPALCTASPKICHDTYPRGTGMSLVRPGLHIKYIVNASDLVTLLSADGRPSEGLSAVLSPVA